MKIMSINQNEKHVCLFVSSCPASRKTESEEKPFQPSESSCGRTEERRLQGTELGLIQTQSTQSLRLHVVFCDHNVCVCRMWMNSFKLNAIITLFWPAMPRLQLRWDLSLFFCPPLFFPLPLHMIFTLLIFLQRFLDVVQSEQSKDISFRLHRWEVLIIWCYLGCKTIYGLICIVAMFIHIATQIILVSSPMLVCAPCACDYRNSSGLCTLLSFSASLCGTRGGSWQTGFLQVRQYHH